MKRYLLITILAFAFAGSGCTRDDAEGPGQTVPGENNGGFPLENDEYVVPGVLHIKLTPQAEERFVPVNTRSGVSTGVASIDRLVDELGITHIRRSFRHGGKHEAKMRMAGLHLWYTVYFDTHKERAMTRAFTDFSALDELEVVEPSMKIKRIEGEITPVNEAELAAMVAATRSEIPTMPQSNDPFLHHQWHYHNEGTLYKAKPGSDINLFEAWKLETGKPQVIVAIIDGGIDTDHPDLKPNLWVNEGELNGAEGVDDDDNGFIDDIHGYNFVTESGKIVAHAHGTHVAGTVAAANNNRIGVAGVAGGNGNPGSGVRLMSCQIFYQDPETGKESVVSDSLRGETFIYAANNGAVIAQNSWEYNYTVAELTKFDRAGIDYFVDWAGKDEYGNQTGPLYGGIVIFATGNSNRNSMVLPSSDSKVFSVSSVGADYEKAPYSNYGSWVNVTAPGGNGEYADGTQIFSTYPFGLYGFMEGTSMACPHVSGIAALVVSRYGVNPDGSINPGFTNEDLKDKLLRGTNRNIEWYNPLAYPMGVGYINAHKALAKDGEIAPDRVGDIDVKWNFDKAVATWRVTEDTDAPDKKTDHYKIVVSEENLYGIDFGALPPRFTTINVSTSGSNVGELMTREITGLEMGKTYYLSIAGFDTDGNISPSSTVKGSLIPNRGPVAKDAPQSVSLRKKEKKRYDIQVYDPEGYSWSHTFVAGSPGATATRTGDLIRLEFDAAGLNPGTYSCTLTLTDAQGTETVLTIPYSVIFFAPQLLKAFEDILFQGPGHERKYELDDYFYDQDGDQITYTASSSNTAVASASIGAGNVLTVASTGLGTATIRVTASDVDAQTETSFTVTSRNASQTVDLYPVPVKKDGVLNIRMGDTVNGDVEVTIYSTSGAKVFHQKLKLANGAAQTLDISSLSTGNYRVVVKYKNEEITRNITKL